MSSRHNVVLLFSKVPEPGLVKTRLTRLKDGVFEPDVASVLYHCMLFDVVEIIMAAFDELENRDAESQVAGSSDGNTYELVISTPASQGADAMRELFESSGVWPRPLTFISDEGASFDEHYNHAFRQVWDRGADTILSMGADMPALTIFDVVRGFEALARLSSSPAGGIVLAPDQEMGVSVVGWTRDTDFDHSGVYYNASGLTVLPAYIAKARAQNLPALYLPPIPDVDTMRDLYHAITVVEALNYCAAFDGNTPPRRTYEALREMGWDQVYVPANNLIDPRETIDIG